MIDLIQGIGAILAAVLIFAIADIERDGAPARIRSLLCICLLVLGLGELMTWAHGEGLSWETQEIIRAVLYWGIAVLCALGLAGRVPVKRWRQFRDKDRHA